MDGLDRGSSVVDLYVRLPEKEAQDAAAGSQRGDHDGARADSCPNHGGGAASHPAGRRQEGRPAALLRPAGSQRRAAPARLQPGRLLRLRREHAHRRHPPEAVAQRRPAEEPAAVLGDHRGSRRGTTSPPWGWLPLACAPSPTARSAPSAPKRRKAAGRRTAART